MKTPRLQVISASRTVESLILSIKAILLGEHGSGRTLIFSRIVGKAASSLITFSGITTGYRILSIADKQVQLAVWDYSGSAVPFGSQVRFFSDAHAVLVVFDVSTRDSFTSARKRVQQIRIQHPAVVIAILGNKADLPRKSWEVHEEDVEELITSIAPLTSFVSAKTGIGVQEILESTVLEVIRKQNRADSDYSFSTV
ncbi:MAG: ADP-ribosylation factor-like protein [Candidatus Heimdallarchaeota archaeon]